MYRKLGVREQAFYRSRSEYEGLKLDQGRRLKQRERENAAGGGPELASDKLILKETAGTASTGSAQELTASQRVYRTFGQPRSTQRYRVATRDDETAHRPKRLRPQHPNHVWAYDFVEVHGFSDDRRVHPRLLGPSIARRTAPRMCSSFRPGSCWNMTARTTSARSTASNCQMLLDRPVMIRRLPSVRSRLSE